MVFVGNKCDLEDRREVTTEEGSKLAVEYTKQGILTCFIEA